MICARLFPHAVGEAISLPAAYEKEKRKVRRIRLTFFIAYAEYRRDVQEAVPYGGTGPYPFPLFTFPSSLSLLSSGQLFSFL